MFLLGIVAVIVTPDKDFIYTLIDFIMAYVRLHSDISVTSVISGYEIVGMYLL